MTRAQIVSSIIVATLLALNGYAAQRDIGTSAIPPIDVSANDSLRDQGESSGRAVNGDLLAWDQDSADSSFQDRPLFSSTRRPPEPLAGTHAEETAPGTEATTSASDDASSGLRLIGIMQLPSRERRALIRSASATNGVWVSLGGEVDGWRVSLIEPDTITVAKTGGSENVTLRTRTSGDNR